MEPFSDVIGLLRPTAVLSKSIVGRGVWGVHYPPYDAPGFAIVLFGQCWLTLENEKTVLLERGDFVLLPTSPAFMLRSRPDAKCTLGQMSLTSLRHGDPEGDPDFKMLGGSFQIRPINAPLLTALLPGMAHIKSSECDTGRLARVIDFIIDECAADRPGRETILERYLEIMLVECLRWPGIGRETLPAGLLAGMRDPAIACALRAIHSDVRAGWTVAALGKIAGMSRSAFSARFSNALGCAPMEYLARWRMTLAQDALSRGGQSLDRLAENIGYESASAFSTAFRRRIGCSPGAFARDYRGRATPASNLAAE